MDTFSVGIGLRDLRNPQPKLRLPHTIQQILSRRLLVLERGWMKKWTEGRGGARLEG